jgi:hypothetical protein
VRRRSERQNRDEAEKRCKSAPHPAPW